ncbi:MAG: hypothetical protein A3G45_00540 [Candidatus Staskawiczbacteria bacterium RIFCSPLOWO2_12_FULL_37_15]|uniref:NAD(P)-binding domain-containing protein n=1 Tax=Candidatus Staskawiczbacteria bacterium RIFCSPLOWO2_12_FULL_37_15 TaxID=1802218 RepID=A0A1G2IQZ9_9BACT|nr:MAG: NAD dependent epimerase/dehydratase family [Parcubacteria group bacterium GW2011_GWA2_37_10]OGZ77143.1 MAG: hypothetical protein A3G45_00540 [Candidatus Staskawiczbacteria bacterium RIFCSPLOWO2_12_FULL_37_15]
MPVDFDLVIHNDIFNVAGGKGEKLVKAAEIIKKELNSKSKIIIRGNRKGEVVKFVADISKAKMILGYKPNYFLKKGISLSIKWYAENYIATLKYGT